MKEPPWAAVDTTGITGGASPCGRRGVPVPKPVADAEAAAGGVSEMAEPDAGRAAEVCGAELDMLGGVDHVATSHVASLQ
jgi:hypothetical protein